MLFVVFWMVSLGVWAVSMAMWHGLALIFGFAGPTPEQVAGCGWLFMGASQIAATVTIGLLIWAEQREANR